MTTPSAPDSSDAAAAAGRWTVAIFALVGLGVALAFYAFQTPNYKAEALVAVSSPAGTVSDEVAVITGSTVIDAATSALGFQPEVTVTAAEVSKLLTVTGQADQAQKAADAANTVAAIYVQARVGTAASVAQQAVPADSPSGVGPLVFAAIGSLLGALFGALVSYFQRFRSERNGGPHTRLPQEPDGIAPAIVAVDLPQPVLAVDESATPPASTPAPHVEPQPVQPQPIQPQPIQPQPIPHQPVPHQPVASPEPAAPTQSAPPTESTDPMEREHTKLANSEMARSFTDASATTTGDAIFDGTWLATGEAPLAQTDRAVAFGEFDRRALQTQYEAALYEMVLTHKEESARSDADHERLVGELRGEVADLHKQVRMRDARLKTRTGTDQNRVGDLEAQTEALEIELSGLRQTLESERIAHAKRLTEERGVADRALDNARRQYREELSKHVHTHRQALADHRGDLDNELAEDRLKHAASLEAEHAEYERQLEIERNRIETKSASMQQRHQQELADIRAANREELDRQARQHKETITELRTVGESSDGQLRDLEKENRLLRAELATQQKQARHDETESASLVQRLTDEIAIMRGELDSERERNAALRSDVLRRSAESHQAIDRAVEERTAQLAELETSVARQREYADKRVRETSAAAEEQAREAAMREADLTASISRLKRELAEANKALGKN